MLIQEIQKQMEEMDESDHPVAKTFHYGENFKVLIFGFKKGMKIEDHEAKHPTKLLVLEGDVIYTQQKKDHRLKKHEEIDIPPHITHNVSAIEDSLILLTQG